MTITVFATIICDRCKWWDERTQAPTRASAIKKARDQGWTVANGKQTCGWCALSPEPDEGETGET